MLFESRKGRFLFARGNLSSIVEGKIPSRRVNRDVTQAESDELCALLSLGIQQKTGIPCIFKSYSTYRLAISIDLGAVEPSDRIGNTDPGYATEADYAVPSIESNFEVVWSAPLDDDPRARHSATVVNEITRVAHELLDQHPINRTRRHDGRLPINHVLMRDFGVSLPNVDSFLSRWGLRAKYFHDLPVELGVAKYLGMDHEEAGCKAANVEAYTSAARLISRDVGSYDLVVFHVKGPDEPGHDGDWRKKVTAIEAVDAGLFGIIGPLLNEYDANLCVTSDHATCWAIGTHTSDRVPLILRPSRSDRTALGLRLTERDCARGTVSIKSAWELMPLLTIGLGQ